MENTQTTDTVEIDDPRDIQNRQIERLVTAFGDSYWKIYAIVPHGEVELAIRKLVMNYPSAKFKTTLADPLQKLLAPEESAPSDKPSSQPRISRVTKLKATCIRCNKTRSLLLKYQDTPEAALCSVCDSG